MLQQTRVEAVTPYFERFLLRFPTMNALAEASDEEVLTAWSGLGYYSRARNLHRAAKHLVMKGTPATYNEVLELPGIGPYSAAAISSIALKLPYAAVDGNVIRVVARLLDEHAPVNGVGTKRRIGETAEALLDSSRPGDFNQAMMELGATVCTPRNPTCLLCPVSAFCAARKAGTERQIPVKLAKAPVRKMSINLLVLRSADGLYLIQRSATESRMADFWELPTLERFPAVVAEKKSSFTHQIVNDRMRISVWVSMQRSESSDGGRWFGDEELKGIPLTTVTRKALAHIQK